MQPPWLQEAPSASSRVGHLTFCSWSAVTWGTPAAFFTKGGAHKDLLGPAGEGTGLSENGLGRLLGHGRLSQGGGWAYLSWEL